MDMEDGFDELLAEIEEPVSPKKPKLDSEQDKAPQPDLIKTGVREYYKITLLLNRQFKRMLDHRTSKLRCTSTEGTKKPSTSKTHCVLVNQRQRGNPLLKFITSVPWEYDDIVPDYEVGKTICLLFLSLRYHNLNPDYINNRLKELGKKYDLRVLLVQVDLKDPHTPLKNLTRICLLTDLTLMLAWSPEEAAKIVENYKIYENKPPDKIMEKIENDPHQKIINALSSIKPVNKTDAMTLITTFGTLENIVKASESRLADCPGFGATKAKKLYKALHEPFLKQNNASKETPAESFEGDLNVEELEKVENALENEIQN